MRFIRSLRGVHPRGIMAGDSATIRQEPEPDHFFLGRLPDRMPDGGPRYKETPPDPYAVPVAEPFNAVTASFFLVIVLAWGWRLWGRFGRYPFLTACGPILLAGGVGGTLYHAFRTQRAYFLLDVIPIQVLGLAGAVYLMVRLGRALGVWRVAGTAVGLLALFALMNAVFFNLLRGLNPNLPVNMAYASLALIVLLPLLAVLVRTRFRHAGWVAGALASFAIAWFCRLVDNTPVVDLPMGTHWLWHTFGAMATWALIEYFYRIEGERLDDTDEKEAVPQLRGNG
jgi:hypothetical protein